MDNPGAAIDVAIEEKGNKAGIPDFTVRRRELLVGYIDNPTFRGMRQSLEKTFDEIYIMDLHGNSKKKESSPDGSKDENVFDIQQGVAVCIMVKYPKEK